MPVMLDMNSEKMCLLLFGSNYLKLLVLFSSVSIALVLSAFFDR